MIQVPDISVINLVLWAIFGFAAGFVAHRLTPGDSKGGVLGTTLLGILGAMLGGFLANALFGIRAVGFNSESFLAAVGGALLLSFLFRLLFQNHGHIKTMTKELR